MSAAKLWWFRVRLVAAFPLLVAAAFLIVPSHFFDMARCIREMWIEGEC